MFFDEKVFMGYGRVVCSPSQGTDLQFTKSHQCLTQRSFSENTSCFIAVQVRKQPGG